MKPASGPTNTTDPSTTGEASPEPESVTNRSMFEALFDRRLKPTGAFAERLKQAGYDPQQPQLKYPTSVWKRCVDLARAERWPDLPTDEAFRAIGREATLGFFETLPGELITAALPFLTPVGFLEKVQNYFRLGREDSGLTFEVLEATDGFARCHLHNPAEVHGGFVAGIIDVAFTKLGLEYELEVKQESTTDYELTVRWKKP